MQFLITAYDKQEEGILARRAELRPSHLENLSGMNVLCAGPIRDEDGNPAGSYLVMEFDNRDQVDDYLASEPYISGGVWGTCKVDICGVAIRDNVILG